MVRTTPEHPPAASEAAAEPAGSYVQSALAGVATLAAVTGFFLSGQPEYPGLSHDETIYEDDTRIETYAIDEGKTPFKTVTTSCTANVDELQKITRYAQPEFAQGNPNPMVRYYPTKDWCDDKKITDTDW